ncbi:MAG: threonylcarbamoyl-AMP synthase [Candidatus Sungbacteria bacterium]|nr:threonylcarbamoyl-AMP synthase [Candidatus Sungbacteria bacterium]
MKILPLNESTIHGVLFEAVQTVKAGGVLVYPTDTVYGIGGNALDPHVTEKILKIKQRPEGRGLILLVKSHADARKYAYIDLWTERILEELWPGPVSVILHKRDNVPDVVAAPNGTIALRIPKAHFPSELLKQIDAPLIATSANRSEDAAPSSTLDAFIKYLETKDVKPELVIDAGDLGSVEPSTLLDLTDKKNPLILRKGFLTKAELDSVLESNLWR